MSKLSKYDPEKDVMIYFHNPHVHEALGQINGFVTDIEQINEHEYCVELQFSDPNKIMEI